MTRPSPLRATRIVGLAVLLLLTGCGWRKECQLDGVSCSNWHTFKCDPCENVYSCARYDDNGPLVWGASDWPCECVADDGTILFDTATLIGDPACEAARD